jgi:hypothetical protein
MGASAPEPISVRVPNRVPKPSPQMQCDVGFLVRLGRSTHVLEAGPSYTSSAISAGSMESGGCGRAVVP